MRPRYRSDNRKYRVWLGWGGSVESDFESAARVGQGSRSHATMLFTLVLDTNGGVPRLGQPSVPCHPFDIQRGLPICFRQSSSPTPCTKPPPVLQKATVGDFHADGIFGRALATLRCAVKVGRVRRGAQVGRTMPECRQTLAKWQPKVA